MLAVHAAAVATNVSAPRLRIFGFIDDALYSRDPLSVSVRDTVVVPPLRFAFGTPWRVVSQSVFESVKAVTYLRMQAQTYVADGISRS